MIQRSRVLNKPKTAKKSFATLTIGGAGRGLPALHLPYRVWLLLVLLLLFLRQVLQKQLPLLRYRFQSHSKAK
jgi:hypothetical protein